MKTCLITCCSSSTPRWLRQIQARNMFSWWVSVIQNTAGFTSIRKHRLNTTPLTVLTAFLSSGCNSSLHLTEQCILKATWFILLYKNCEFHAIVSSRAQRSLMIVLKGLEKKFFLFQYQSFPKFDGNMENDSTHYLRSRVPFTVLPPFSANILFRQPFTMLLPRSVPGPFHEWLSGLGASTRLRRITALVFICSWT